MTHALETRILFESRTLAVSDVVCRAGRCDGSAEEEMPAATIVLVRRGVFVRDRAGERTVGDAHHALFFDRGDVYRTAHPADDGDRCTVLSFSRATVRAALPPARRGHEARFPRGAARTGRAEDALHRWLAATLADGPVEPMVVHEAAHRLLERLATPDDAEGPTRAHRDLARAAQEWVGVRAREDWTLDDLAGAVGCSPFHLCRVFGRVVGRPIHRYRNRLRLREGLDRLLDGERDLTALALSLGFYDHSHFTNAFRREFGRAPSGVRGPEALAALRRAWDLRA